ncbi:hypothetical protein N0B51_12720 [Tsuneonella sp. YG55]|uniref:Uncharacterized protein n=1 Tax=Tsuneonella litorea TaxID=2976475 RepID=A0A9X2W4F4_9SPHN|nr:hypothetical protein [Tsuneonella litorea]MCT2559840.1 hypothetical protein [Tsuneonella litorea]
MARNTGEGHRIGAIGDRTQVRNPITGRWAKRDRSSGENAGEFIAVKRDGEPFKGVAREPDGRRSAV